MSFNSLSYEDVLYRMFRKGRSRSSEGRGHRFESCRVRHFSSKDGASWAAICAAALASVLSSTVRAHRCGLGLFGDRWQGAC